MEIMSNYHRDFRLRSKRNESFRNINDLSSRPHNRSSGLSSEERVNRQVIQHSNTDEEDTRSETSKSNFEWLKKKSLKWSKIQVKRTFL